MTLSRYTLTNRVTVPAGVSSFLAGGPPSTASGTTGAAPSAGTTVTSLSVFAGTWLFSWTATLQTAAAGGDANNFGLYSAPARPVMGQGLDRNAHRQRHRAHRPDRELGGLLGRLDALLAAAAGGEP